MSEDNRMTPKPQRKSTAKPPEEPPAIIGSSVIEPSPPSVGQDAQPDDLEERIAKAARAVMKQATSTTTRRKRQAAIYLVEKHKCRLGTKAIDRLIMNEWNDEYIAAFGAPPNARSVRRWCKTARTGGCVPRRPHTNPNAVGPTGAPATKADRMDDGATVTIIRPWLPAPGECRFVDGARITAVQVTGGGLIYRIDAAEKSRDDHAQGLRIEAEAELARIVASQSATGPDRLPDVRPPWRRHSRRVQAPATVDPKIGERVVVGGVPGVFLGRTLVGRMAVAQGRFSGRPPRRRMRTYPAATAILRDTTSGKT